MAPIIRWFVLNPVAANLLMWVLLIAGFISVMSTYREEFPNIDTDIVSITIPYQSASPEEVEEAICIRVEEAIEGTPGVKSISSTASEGLCSAQAELEKGVDKGKVVDDIKSRIDSISSFPTDIDEPQIKELDILANVLQILLSGNADERSLKALAWRLREDITALPGVSQVNVLYTRPYEFSIEISEFTLRRYGMTLSQVADAIRANSLDLPGGSIKSTGGDILIRTTAEAQTAREFEEIIILTREDGAVVKLGDIAKVIDGFRDSDLKVRFDGTPAVMLVIKRIGEEDVINLAERVKSYLETAEPDLPEGIKLTIWKDESQDLIDRMEVLSNNAGGGLILVLLTLTLFLKARLALWVAIGLPVALMGTLTFFPVFGIAISTLSIVAFILVLGILVDDAVVIAERVYAHQQMGKTPTEAAIDGTVEMSTPVIFGVLTTMVAFSAFMSIPSGMGSWFTALGAVVIIALFFSLVESQLILPVHLKQRLVDPGEEGEKGLAAALQNFATIAFKPALLYTMRNRYTAIAIAVALLFAITGLMGSGRVVFQFFPALAGERVYASLTLPEGTDIGTTEHKVEQLERAVEQLRLELDANLEPGEPSMIQHVISSIGSPLMKGSISSAGLPRSNFADIGLELRDPEGNGIDTRDVVKRWRELTGPIPGAVELVFDYASFSFGKAIDIEIRGRDLDDLKTAAARLKEKLSGYPGVFDIADSFRAGKQELQLKLKPEARSLGLSARDLATQVREAFFGIEVQRIQRGADDMRVMVRYPAQQRRSPGDLESMMIRTRDGNEVPFTAVADVQSGRGFSSIRRIDGQRVVSVYADVDRAVIKPETVLNSVQKELMPQIAKDLPDVEFALAGEASERSDSLSGILRNALLALFVMYALLAIPLKSYLQPLVIMAVIPFGVIGAILGHYVLGYELIIFSLLGIVALAGVVVNSSLVLVDYINRQRQQGVPVEQACIEAAMVRFRPIVLTSFTTVVGLIPMIANSTNSTFMFVPLAVSLSSGILVATFINLLLVPCFYMVLEDGLKFMGKSKEGNISAKPVAIAEA